MTGVTKVERGNYAVILSWNRVAEKACGDNIGRPETGRRYIVTLLTPATGVSEVTIAVRLANGWLAMALGDLYSDFEAGTDGKQVIAWADVPRPYVSEVYEIEWEIER